MAVESSNAESPLLNPTQSRERYASIATTATDGDYEADESQDEEAIRESSGTAAIARPPNMKSIVSVLLLGMLGRACLITYAKLVLWDTFRCIHCQRGYNNRSSS